MQVMGYKIQANSYCFVALASLLFRMQEYFCFFRLEVYCRLSDGGDCSVGTGEERLVCFICAHGRMLKTVLYTSLTLVILSIFFERYIKSQAVLLHAFH